MTRQKSYTDVTRAALPCSKIMLIWLLPFLRLASTISLATIFLFDAFNVHMVSCAYACSGTAWVHVNARVPPYLKLNVLKQPATLLITEEDINRGFVDISDATMIYIESNPTRMLNIEIKAY